MKKLAAMLAVLGFAVFTAFPLAAASGAAPPLVDHFYLWAHFGSPNFVVLDVGGDETGRTRADYLAAHIPGAVYTDYKKDGWRVTNRFGTPGMLTRDKITKRSYIGGTFRALEKLIGKLGINNGTQVVIVTAGKTAKDLAAGTRIYWTFKVLGHDKVSILDGGMDGYSREKVAKLNIQVNAVETGDVKPPTARFKANPRLGLIATKRDMRNALVRDSITVDNRTHAEFTGVKRHPAVARVGTMHQAKNLPYTWLIDKGSATFQTKENLLKLYDEAGIPTTGRQINFCNTGHEATLGWFVSYELLGNKQAKVYDGSMAEWAADTSLPMLSMVYLQ